MVLTFFSCFAKPLKITGFSNRTIRFDGTEKVYIYRRKIGSGAEWEYIGTSSVCYFESEKIEPWYEFGVSYYETKIADASPYDTYTSEIDERTFSPSARRVVYDLPENVHQKNEKDSNANRILHAIFPESDQFQKTLRLAYRTKNFQSVDFMKPDVEYKVSNQQIETLESDGKTLFSKDEIDFPDSYQFTAFLEKSLFSSDDLHHLNVNLLFFWIDECGRTHPLELRFNTHKEMLEVCSAENHDVYSHLFLMDDYGNQIRSVDGLDSDEKYIYVLNDALLHVYSIPSKTYVIMSPIKTIAMPHKTKGLKMGTSYLITKGSCLELHETNYQFIVSSGNGTYCYGKKRYYKDFCSGNVLNEQIIEERNITNELDDFGYTLGLKRVKGVRTSEFYIYLNGVNGYQMKHTHDRFGAYLKNLPFRNTIERLPFTQYNLKNEDRHLEDFYRKEYGKTASKLRWGDFIER